MMKNFLTILLVLCLVSVVQASKLIPNGSTSQSITVVINDADGEPNASATITDLDFYVQLDGASAQSAKTDLTALGSAETAWDDYKAYHMGNGLFRIDIPDANLSNGAGSLLTYIIADGATSNRTSYYEVQLETVTVAAVLVDTAAMQPIISDIGGLSEIGDKVQADMDANSLLVNLTAARAGYLDNINNALLIELGLSEIGDKVQADMDANSADLNTIVTATGAAAIRTSVWTAAAASYDVEDSFGNIINDLVAEYATDGIYYLAALDEDSTTIDLDSTTVIATLDAAGVDLIWDELLSGHTTVGSAGEALIKARDKRGY